MGLGSLESVGMAPPHIFSKVKMKKKLWGEANTSTVQLCNSCESVALTLDCKELG